MNADAFFTYVTGVLLPGSGHGNVVTFNNLSSHKEPTARTAIESVGAKLLFLPPYLPAFNPVEQAFAKLISTCAKPPSEPSKAS